MTNAKDTELYRERGFGVRLGGGRKPAYIVVDLAEEFTDPRNAIGWDLDAVVGNTRRILDAMRERGQLVVFLTVALEPQIIDNLAVEKMPVMRSLRSGSPGIEIDERLGRRDDEPVIAKQYFSGFFGTPLASLLTNHGVDTVLIGGTSTSGCVRATAMDAIANGFRPLVVEDCCGDRSVSAHEANLFDIDQKYGDVISLDDALAYIESFPLGASA